MKIMLIVAQLATTQGIDGTGSPAFSAPRLEDQAVTIDAVLEEPAWQQAARLTGFWQYQPVDGRRAEEETDVLVWYAPDAIHFGIIARDRTPGGIVATVADRDNLGDEDRVTIYLDTFNDRRRAFFFTVNALGSQEDGVRTEGGVSAGNIFGGSVDRNPDYYFESAGRLTGDGYIIEIRIPFKSLRLPSSSVQSWGINVLRTVPRTGHEYTWTDTRRASASFINQSGVLEGLTDLQRGIVTEIQPFATTSWNGARTATGFERADPDPSAGANIRIGLTSISIDGTINPDFSQVESDAGLVTTNERFALFFPEKRPFFLEGIELFSTPNQLIYSRQIDNPIAGGKVTGKLGRNSIAYIGAVDETSSGDAVFNVARFRRDVGANSVLAATITDRRIDGDYNTVTAADARVVFGGMYYLEGQVGSAWTEVDGTSINGHLWKAEFDRTGRGWGFNYQINGISDDFVSRSGFVPRNNFLSARGFNRFSLYGAEGSAIQNFTTFFGVNRLWSYTDVSAGAIEGSEEVNGSVTFMGGARISSNISRDFVEFDPASFEGYSVSGGNFVIPTEADNLFSGSLRINSPSFRQFSLSAGVNYGETAIFAEGSEGTELRLNGSLTLRPLETLRAEGTIVLSRITRDYDGSEFARTIIPRLRVEFQPVRAFRVRLVSEYRSVRRGGFITADGQQILVDGSAVLPGESGDLRLDLLLAYEPVVGTAAFLGYGTSMDSPDSFGISSLDRRNDGFFVKVSYQFRR